MILARGDPGFDPQRDYQFVLVFFLSIVLVDHVNKLYK